MRFLLEKGVVLKKTIGVVGELMDVAVLIFDENGLKFSGMDSSHVSMVSTTFDKSLFKEYELPEGNLSIGIGLKTFTSILKLVSDNDQLQVKHDGKSNGDVVNIQFADTKKGRNYDFDVKLMEIDNEELGVPDIHFTHALSLVATDFYQMMSDCVVFGDSVKLAISKNVLASSVEGEAAKSFMSLTGTRIGDEADEQLSMKFALRYLLAFAKGRDVSKTILVKMVDGMPLQIRFNIDEEGKSNLTFYLAPKIEDDDDNGMT